MIDEAFRMRIEVTATMVMMMMLVIMLLLLLLRLMIVCAFLHGVIILGELLVFGRLLVVAILIVGWYGCLIGGVAKLQFAQKLECTRT